MSYVFELIAQKNMLNKKIEEVKHMFSYEQTDDLAQEFLGLLELKQSKLLNIASANRISKLNVGGTEIDITTAVIIRDIIKEKVDFLTGMIANKDCTLSKLGLQKQRDKFHEEFVLLTMGIERSDLTTTVN